MADLGMPQKKYVPITIPIGAAELEIVLPPLARWKSWQVFVANLTVPAKSALFNLSLNGHILGLYVEGNDTEGAFGEIKFVDFYGPNAIYVTQTDSLTIKANNSSGVIVETGISLFLREYDV